MDYISIAKEVLNIEAQELLDAANRVDDHMEKAVKLISGASGKLI